jgi:hypothetical protein
MTAASLLIAKAEKSLLEAFGLRFLAVSKMSGCITTKNLAAPLLGTRWQ